MTPSQLHDRARRIELAGKRNLTPEDVREMREIEQQRTRELREEAQLDKEQNEPPQPAD
jgi:hypothetical protein